MDFAVLTGDLVSSSKLNEPERVALLSVLKASFETVGRLPQIEVRGRFEIFRGDSFQGVLAPASLGARAALALVAAVRASSPLRGASSVRVAVGVGPVDSLPLLGAGTGEASGPAFVRSGKALDAMKGTQRLSIVTSRQTVDDEFEVECRLLDSILLTWSARQAAAVLLAIEGLTQQQAAERIGISQPAAATRLRRAGWDGIRVFLARAETILKGEAEQ